MRLESTILIHLLSLNTGLEDTKTFGFGPPVISKSFPDLHSRCLSFGPFRVDFERQFVNVRTESRCTRLFYLPQRLGVAHSRLRSSKLKASCSVKPMLTIAIWRGTPAQAALNLRTGQRCFCVCIFAGVSSMAIRSNG